MPRYTYVPTVEEQRDLLAGCTCRLYIPSKESAMQGDGRGCIAEKERESSGAGGSYSIGERSFIVQGELLPLVVEVTLPEQFRKRVIVEGVVDDEEDLRDPDATGALGMLLKEGEESGSSKVNPVVNEMQEHVNIESERAEEEEDDALWSRYIESVFLENARYFTASRIVASFHRDSDKEGERNDEAGRRTSKEHAEYMELLVDGACHSTPMRGNELSGEAQEEDSSSEGASSMSRSDVSWRVLPNGSIGVCFSVEATIVDRHLGKNVSIVVKVLPPMFARPEEGEAIHEGQRMCNSCARVRMATLWAVLKSGAVVEKLMMASGGVSLPQVRSESLTVELIQPLKVSSSWHEVGDQQYATVTCSNAAHLPVTFEFARLQDSVGTMLTSSEMFDISLVKEPERLTLYENDELSFVIRVQARRSAVHKAAVPVQSGVIPIDIVWSTPLLSAPVSRRHNVPWNPSMPLAFVVSMSDAAQSPSPLNEVFNATVSITNITDCPQHVIMLLNPSIQRLDESGSTETRAEHAGSPLLCLEKFVNIGCINAQTTVTLQLPFLALEAGVFELNNVQIQAASDGDGESAHSTLFDLAHTFVFCISSTAEGASVSSE